jgi:hypothetical protein
MKKINWWQVAFEIVKTILLALAGASGAQALL